MTVNCDWCWQSHLKQNWPAPIAVIMSMSLLPETEMSWTSSRNVPNYCPGWSVHMTNNACWYKDSNCPSILSGLLMFRKEMCPWIVWTPVEGIAGIMKIHIMFCLDYREFQHILCNNVLCNIMIIAKGLFIFRYLKGNAKAPECFDTDLCCFVFCFVLSYF